MSPYSLLVQFPSLLNILVSIATITLVARTMRLHFLPRHRQVVPSSFPPFLSPYCDPRALYATEVERNDGSFQAARLPSSLLSLPCSHDLHASRDEDDGTALTR